MNKSNYFPNLNTLIVGSRFNIKINIVDYIFVAGCMEDFVKRSDVITN